MTATRCYECADERTPLCRMCLRRWLDRKPPRPLSLQPVGIPAPWRDFEPMRCIVEPAGNGWRAVTDGKANGRQDAVLGASSTNESGPTLDTKGSR